ncbi:hypothetical protein BGP75_00745 [Motiliproteus sp. MSK22-1]|nr:hypothetical protein BGP75_00745 [Motiliproteus sp. MSK22-1]
MLDLCSDTDFGLFYTLLDLVDGRSLLQRSDATWPLCNIPLSFTVFESIPFLDADIARIGKGIGFITM